MFRRFLSICLLGLISRVAFAGRTISARGGSHSYPHSTGYSGYGSQPRYGTGQGHSYPASGGLSGVGSGAKTSVHHHYHYNPPQHITYPSAHGAVHYPVYHGQPPVYVYEYRNSGSRFDTLLTGLALYNLGTMSSNSHRRSYRSSPGETCLLGIRKTNGDYEETLVDCKIMTFVWAEEASGEKTVNTSIVTTNVTIVNVAPQVNDTVYSNGTVDVTTVTVTNKTVVEAVKAKGTSMKVTPGMQCYMIRTTAYSNMKKTLPCEVLLAYANTVGGASKVMPTFTLLLVAICLYNQ